jgi:hypothetical protein
MARQLRTAQQLFGILSVLILLTGCPKAPPSGVRFPITSGSHRILPTAQDRILLYGDPVLIDIGAEWLRSHHYSNILLPDKSPFRSQEVSHGSSNRKAALAVATDMRAEFVLLLEREESKEGTLLEPQCGAFFSVDVSVQALAVGSGATVLRGNAHYPHCVDLGGETYRSLTCQALATAWGFRPSGQLEIPSSLMCTAGQTDPMPIR